MRPLLAITPGEPAGIGPDLITQLIPTEFDADLLIIANIDLLEQRATAFGQTLNAHLIDPSQAIRSQLDSTKVNVLSRPLAAEVTPGCLNTANASYVLGTLERAVQLIETDQCDALVTGPVQKSIISEAGFKFSGHTEWLAQRTKTDQVVMMLASDSLRVTLATTHLPLSEVPGAIQFSPLLKTIEIIHNDLVNQFGIASPRILVCGLNPHAGENGHMGREEIDTIIPALNAARAKNINVIGPIPADTAFTAHQLEQADVVLAMYHDQGLPVLKHQSFGRAVNITLGLPLIRTSVDHGTALDLAGKKQADVGSLNTAIKFASDMALSQNKAAI